MTATTHTPTLAEPAHRKDLAAYAPLPDWATRRNPMDMPLNEREALNDYLRMRQQRDQLVAALREIATARAGDDKFDAYDAADRYRNIARAALAKVKP